MACCCKYDNKIIEHLKAQSREYLFGSLACGVILRRYVRPGQLEIAGDDIDLTFYEVEASRKDLLNLLIDMYYDYKAYCVKNGLDFLETWTADKVKIEEHQEAEIAKALRISSAICQVTGSRDLNQRMNSEETKVVSLARRA